MSRCEPAPEHQGKDGLHVVQRARDISQDDALAEGVHWGESMEGYSINDDGSFYHGSDPAEAWWQFFSYLHRPKTSTGDITDYIAGRPEWNPVVLAFTFTVHHSNIDAMEAAT